MRPGIVHRLDKDTSGVMVAAKDDQSHRGLSELFANKDLEREYVAIISPPVTMAQGSFTTLYGRHPVHRKKFSSRVKKGKHAKTNFTVEERFGKMAAQVRCVLETGRTHQIRVHMEHIRFALLGDPIYGHRLQIPKGSSEAFREALRNFKRQALHAAKLGLEHPTTGEWIEHGSPLPEDMRVMLQQMVEDREAHRQ